MKTYLDYPTGSNKKLARAFLRAVLNNQVDKVRDLLMQGVNPCANYNNAFYKAASFGYTDMVKLLLNNKEVRSTIDRLQAIKIAAEHNHIRTVNCLTLQREVETPGYLEYIWRSSSKKISKKFQMH